MCKSTNLVIAPPVTSSAGLLEVLIIHSSSSAAAMCQVQQNSVQQEANNGSILLVGPCQVGKYTLAKRLLQPETGAETNADGPQLWHLDTKYYTTDVSIHRSHPSDHAYQQAIGSQGIVLVFAADSEASFQAVSQWAEQLPSSAGEIKLCVANKADTIAAQHTGACEQKAELWHSSWLTSAITWCAENQYEYIEASSTNNQLDQKLVREEQKQGIHRIKQALEANYWPNLVMKQPQLNHGEAPQPRNHASSQTAQTADQENEDSCSSSDLSDQEGHAFSQFQSAEEEQLDQFDRMFGELRATRDKLQHLPRERRQHAAADMALRIASMLGLDDSDGDEDPLLSQVL